MNLSSSSPYLGFLLSSINRNTSEGTNLVATDIKQYLCRFFCLKTQNVFSDFCTSSVLLRHNIKRSNIANIKKKKRGPTGKERCADWTRLLSGRARLCCGRKQPGGLSCLTRSLLLFIQSQPGVQPSSGFQKGPGSGQKG